MIHSRTAALCRAEALSEHRAPRLPYSAFQCTCRADQSNHRLYVRGAPYGRGGVGFIVTNLNRPPERVVKFYNGRATAEQHSKEGKTRCAGRGCPAMPSGTTPCGSSSTRLLQPRQLPAHAGGAGGGPAFGHSPAVREKLVKIGARIVHHDRYVVFQLAEVAVPRALFADILRRIDGLRPQPPPLPA